MSATRWRRDMIVHHIENTHRVIRGIIYHTVVRHNQTGQDKQSVPVPWRRGIHVSHVPADMTVPADWYARNAALLQYHII